MKILNNSKKAQGLPLNTIVLAILVIIVLLVIVVFFTSKIGQTSKSLDQNGQVSTCSLSNVAIKSLGYTHVAYSTSSTDCSGSGLGTNAQSISVIPPKKDSSGNTVGICCGTKS